MPLSSRPQTNSELKDQIDETAAHRYVVIMAGGIGSRFWPLSRSAMPKQFLDVLGVGKSLLQLTYERFINLIPRENIFVITNEGYGDLILEQLKGIDASRVILEPSRRNTAPCIAYACFRIHQLDPKATVVVSPSDHLILDEHNFRETVEHGYDVVNAKDVLVTIGIHPTRPETEYGYIQFVEDHPLKGAFKAKTFIEKPILEVAKSLIKGGDYLWNSGIFIWNTKTLLNGLHDHLSELFDLFNEGKKLLGTKKERDFIENIYPQCPSISIDYALMEKAKNVMVIPANFGWSDLGTWNSLYENYEKDYYGNAVKGKNVMIYDSHNCMVMVPDKKLAVIQGLEDYIIIDTEKALYLCHKSHENRIREVVNDIKRMKGDSFL